MKTTPYPRMHVSYYVSDIDKTVAFYTKFFGDEPVKVKQGYAKYELQSPALVISFVMSKDKVRPDFGHLGFQVESKEELDAKLTQIKKHQLEYLEENEVSCCYAKQDKFWVTDPDGIKWEVYQFHEDVEFNDPHYATACCPTDEAKDDKEVCCEPEMQCC